MDYWYSHEVSQQTIYDMEILSFKHVRDDALPIGIGIEFHSLGAVYEYDLSTRTSETLEQLMHHRPTIAVYDYGFLPLASVNLWYKGVSNCSLLCM